MPLIPEEELRRSVSDRFQTRKPLPRGAPARTGSSPAPAQRGASLEAVLANRRSVRRFSGEPVRYSRLVGVLAAAAASQEEQWPTVRHGDAGLRTLLAVYRADAIAPGLYSWDGPDRLQSLGEPAWLPELAHSCSGMAAIALVCGPLRDVAAEAYGGVLVRAGALGYAVWLAARTHGLECSVFGGANYQASRAAHRIEAGQRHLFTAAIGHAPR